MVLSDREQRTSKVSKSHALAVRLTDFDLFSESHEAYTFSHEFYKILTISSRIFIFYLLSTYNSIICNMKRALPLWEKVWRVRGVIISFAFCQLTSIPKRQKRKRFYYCYFNMASSAKKMKSAATYKYKFKEEWSKQYPISRSDSNPYAFYCIPCKRSVSCSHQGFSDVTKHCKGLTRVSFAKAIKNNRSITTFLADNDEGANSLKEKTIRVEVLHTNFMVQHNLSFLTAEHLSPLYSKMFPDSKIARNFKCSRNKARAI